MTTEPEPATVLAIDNVPLELPVAGPGSRVLAAFLDYLLVGLASIVWVVGGGMLAGAFKIGGGWLVGVLIVGLFVLDYGYFAGMEAGTGGRTLGKRALGLIVVTESAGRPSTSALLLRNAVRSIDVLFGLPLMAVDARSRRLGDRLAGTLVVHADVAAEREVVLRRVPQGWGAREVTVAESFLRRLPDLEPDRAEAMARQLLALIERDDPAFLAGVPEGLGSVATLRRALEEPEAA